MMGTKIEWCSHTINPVVGCSKISAGCRNCYAENMARRLAAMGLEQYCDVAIQQNPHNGNYFYGGWNGTTAFVPSELGKPYKWKKPKTIFVSSMGDLFHESVDTRWIDKVMHAVHHNPKHSFIFLTKRPGIMKLYFDRYVELYGSVAANLILGVSVEDQATANDRIPVLLQIPAAKRFVSIEPMIGPVDLLAVPFKKIAAYEHNGKWSQQGLSGVILGGESGTKARYMNPDWVRLVRDQCAAASVPFMFKQWGEWLPVESVDHPVYAKKHQFMNGQHYYKVGTKAAGNILDGRTHTELAWEVTK